MKTFRTLINGKNPSRIEFFDSHISMVRETSQEAHSHISSILDIQGVNEQELTAVPDFYQPLEQERFTAWGCIINHLYGDKSILRKERGMCSYELLWLKWRVDIKKSIMKKVLYTTTVLLCELWQFLKNFCHCPSCEYDICFSPVYSCLEGLSHP